MKLRPIILFILLLLFIAAPNQIFAHVLESNSSVGAVMHIQPEDDPIAGAESMLFFEFKDTENAFKHENCECKFIIIQNGKEIYSQPLSQDNWDQNTKNASVVYTFPKQGVYKVQVQGKPLDGESFTAFTLEYEVRVNRILEPSKIPENKPWYSQHIPTILGGVIGISALAFGGLAYYRNRNRKK